MNNNHIFPDYWQVEYHILAPKRYSSVFVLRYNFLIFRPSTKRIGYPPRRWLSAGWGRSCWSTCGPLSPWAWSGWSRLPSPDSWSWTSSWNKQQTTNYQLQLALTPSSLTHCTLSPVLPNSLQHDFLKLLPLRPRTSSSCQTARLQKDRPQ